MDLILNSDQQIHADDCRQKVANLPDNVKLSGSITLDSDEQRIYMGVQRAEDSWGLMALDIRSAEYSKIIDSDFKVGH